MSLYILFALGAVFSVLMYRIGGKQLNPAKPPITYDEHGGCLLFRGACSCASIPWFFLLAFLGANAGKLSYTLHALAGILFPYSIMLAIAYFQRKRNYPILYFVFAILGSIANVLYLICDLIDHPHRPEAWHTIVTNGSFCIAWALFWAIYFKISRRAQGTFANA